MKYAPFKVKMCAVLCATLVGVIGVLAMCSCFGVIVKTESSERELPAFENVPREYWATLAEKRILFGHQSVGYNILDGIKDVMKEHDYIRVNIVEISDLSQIEQPALAHWRAGENRKPLSKIKAFVDSLDRHGDAGVDIAFVKLCYVDITHNSDVDSVFRTYVEAIEQLKKQHPNVEYIHVTTPLCSVETGVKWHVKQCVKRLIGRPTVLEDNYQRHRYNQLLRETYPGVGRIYDLALVESTTAQGQSCYVEKSHEKVPFLCIDYSDDGGHLNALGRRRAAEQLLITLARVANE